MIDEPANLLPKETPITHRYRFTPSDVRDQLAMDEAMLLAAEAGEIEQAFRTWNFDQHVVVLGRSSKVYYEVDVEYCRSSEIPILRRCTGGASVVGGPGCMMYSVVLDARSDPSVKSISGAHEYVMRRVLDAVRCQQPSVKLQGICDLTYGDRKFSGNSLRITRNHVLYHGTILHDADLELLARCLTQAPRQPDYRRSRPHVDFVCNLSLDPQRLTEDLASQFGARSWAESTIVADRISELRADRYDLDQWHFRH